MTDDFDDFVSHLQQEIYDETKAAYGQKVFDRWLNPSNMGSLEKADGAASVRGSCGDTMEMSFQMEGERILRARFMTDGCGSSTVCGSVAAELAEGKTLEEAASIDGNVILEILGGLPEEEQHCAFLAADALHSAIHDHFRRSAAPDPF